ncbi:MAG: peptidase [Thermoguttaceae bacterium]|jgi:hypothetical protein|nr:peptidase [Thermoguttaceae bacterium]
MMTLFRWHAVLATAVVLAGSGPLVAQSSSNNPHAGYVFPGGGCRGTKFDVVVGGQHLKEVNRAYISGGGIQTKIVKWYRPMTQGEYTALNMKINNKREELESSGKHVTREEVIKLLGITTEQLREMAIYEQRQADRKRQPNPQIEEELTVQVEIAPDAAFGDRELRLLTPTGMSRPLWFWVGQWPETREKEPNDLAPDPSVQVQLPMVINGQIMPGDTDRFLFEAKKGTKLVAHCAARELIPYLADAVPGWFQAVLHLYDERGNEVAFADSLGFRHDPVLYYEIPSDGKYVIEVHDSIYRGREDFTYRISIGEIPYVTGLFPLGGRVGSGCNVQVLGWNLPVDSIRIEPSFHLGRMIRPVVIEKDNIFSNRVGFIVDVLPEVFEKKDDNDTPETAQRVGSPVVINGRIERPDDVDYYQFDASGVIVAEVFARRLYSPLDSVVRLTDGRGRVLAHNDDYEDKSWPLITHHADSRLLTTTKGAQYISIRDAQRRGGPDFAYRLYIRPPRPDFDLRVTPSSVTARPGALVPITVHAIRKDGFDDDIALALDGAPSGFGLGGAWVPGGQSKVRLTLTVPPQPTKEPIVLQLVGQAMARGRPLVRPALPAEEWTQAFAYQHVVPTKDWTVFVTGSPAGKPPLSVVDRGVKLPAGGTGQIRFMVDQGHNPRDFRFELSEPPPGITLQDPVPVGLGPGLILPVKCDPEKVKAGQKGNLLLNLFQEYSYVSKEGKKPTTARNLVGLLPAIPFEVVSGR